MTLTQILDLPKDDPRYIAFCKEVEEQEYPIALERDEDSPESMGWIDKQGRP